MAPPWYDSSDPTTAVLGPPAADDEPLMAPPPPIEPAADWSVVWKGAWEGMARTDPKAHWLYQGWAIRGWNNAAGASRLKALYDVVPKGQWIVSDMDVKGIWRYFGNYRCAPCVVACTVMPQCSQPATATVRAAACVSHAIDRSIMRACLCACACSFFGAPFIWTTLHDFGGSACTPCTPYHHAPGHHSPDRPHPQIIWP
jgi:hypothetical protein